MPVFNEALEWRDCAEQAREVAGQLTDPGAKRGPCYRPRRGTSTWRGLPPIEPGRRSATLRLEVPPIHRADRARDAGSYGVAHALIASRQSAEGY
jgi:hypothetical protein